MMGRLKSDQGQLFYEFHLNHAVPEDHLVRKIDAVLDLSWLRSELAPHYSFMGRPSIDPELMIRMLVVGYVFAIRSERLICREVQVNLAYRWFCKLGIEDAIPDHSAFSRARNERFRDGDVIRRVFERIVETCLGGGLVGGDGFAVDARLIAADANKPRSPSRGATFDMTRQATFTTAQAGSGLGRVAPCMRARRFCIAPASSTAMYVRSNRSAVQKNHRARSRAISMSMPATLPGRSLAPKGLSSRDVSARRLRCGSRILSAS